jgi:hypothetical protein
VAPAWQEKTYLCVYDSAQVLKVVMAHNMETGAACMEALGVSTTHGKKRTGHQSPVHMVAQVHRRTT